VQISRDHSNEIRLKSLHISHRLTYHKKTSTARLEVMFCGYDIASGE